MALRQRIKLKTFRFGGWGTENSRGSYTDSVVQRTGRVGNGTSSDTVLISCDIRYLKNNGEEGVFLLWNILTFSLTYMATASTGSASMSIENSSGGSTAEDCSGAHVKIEEDFLNSGRTGRRNAIPDIYCPQSRVSTAELPANFARLSCEESGQTQGSSNTNVGPS